MNKYLLKNQMSIHCDTDEGLSRALDIHKHTLYMKMSGRQTFTLKELKIIKNRYNLSSEKICEIFDI